MENTVSSPAAWGNRGEINIFAYQKNGGGGGGGGGEEKFRFTNSVHVLFTCSADQAEGINTSCKKNLSIFAGYDLWPIFIATPCMPPFCNPDTGGCNFFAVRRSSFGFYSIFRGPSLVANQIQPSG